MDECIRPPRVFEDENGCYLGGDGRRRSIKKTKKTRTRRDMIKRVIKNPLLYKVVRRKKRKRSNPVLVHPLEDQSKRNASGSEILALHDQTQEKILNAMSTHASTETQEIIQKVKRSRLDDPDRVSAPKHINLIKATQKMIEEEKERKRLEDDKEARLQSSAKSVIRPPAEEDTAEEKTKSLPPTVRRSPRFGPSNGVSRSSLENNDGSETGNAMTDGDLQEVVAENHYDPIYVIAADEFPLILPHITPQTREIGIVMNNQKRGEDLDFKHWIAIYISRDQVAYFDSLMGKPAPTTIRGIKSLVKAMKIDVFLKFKINRVKLQSNRTQDCGAFCLWFLTRMLSGMTFKEATLYDGVGSSEITKAEKSVREFVDGWV